MSLSITALQGKTVAELAEVQPAEWRRWLDEVRSDPHRLRLLSRHLAWIPSATTESAVLDLLLQQCDRDVDVGLCLSGPVEIREEIVMRLVALHPYAAADLLNRLLGMLDLWRDYNCRRGCTSTD